MNSIAAVEVKRMNWAELLGSIAAGIATLSAGIYMVFRRLKGDQKSDGLDGKADAIITKLEGQLDAERTRNSEYHAAIERIAQERNEAVQNVGRLEGHVQALETQISHLRDEVVHLEAENVKLVEAVNGMKTEMANMTEKFAQLMASAGFKA